MFPKFLFASHLPSNILYVFPVSLIPAKFPVYLILLDILSNNNLSGKRDDTPICKY
jgi:hypothetical protein